MEKMNANTNDPKAQYEKMIGTPIPKLITTLAIPTVISMLITSIYNMADTFFVSQINTQASAAVGIIFPVMAIIQAMGFTLGMGCGSIISRKLGEEKNDEASVMASSGFWAALAFGLILALFGNIFINPLLKVVGASETILPYARDYAFLILYGAPFICASFVLNNILRSEGKAFFSMISLTSGGILNIILDPIFIFGLKMGIKGAALATVTSQVISFLLLLSWFIRRKAICSLKITFFSAKPAILGLIIATGMPSLARQGLASIASILLNREAGLHGDAAISAMTIVTKIVMFIASIMIGIGQGFSPVAGYNYGAKRYDRVRKSLYFLLTSSTALMFGLSLLCFIFSQQIITAFRNDPDVIAIGKVALRWQVIIMPLHSVIVGTNMLMQSTGHIGQATFLSCNRQGTFFIPAILILPFFFGLFGVEIAQAVADALSVLASIPFLVMFMRKLKRLESE